MAFDPSTALPLDQVKRPTPAVAKFDPSTARPVAAANDADVPAEFRSAPAAPPPPSSFRATDIPKEVVAGALEGTGAAVSGAGELGRMVARPIVSGVNAVAGSDVLPEPVNAFKPIGNIVSGAGEKVAASESDAAKAAKERPIVTGDITKPETLALGEGAKSPASLALGAANLVGQAVPMLAGGLEGRALKVAPDVAEALPGVMAKLQRGEALTAAEARVAEAGNAAMANAGKRAVATGAGIGGLQGAMASADAEHERIMGLADQDLSVLPGYQKNIAAGMSPADARKALAEKSAEDTFAATLPVATAAGAVGTAPLLHDAQGALSKIAGEGVVRRAATGAALEAPVQAGAAVAQNAASIAASNEATGGERDLSENSAAMAATGAALGGAFGAFGAAATRPQPKAKIPFPDAAPGSMSEAANVQAATRPAPRNGADAAQPEPSSTAAGNQTRAAPGTQGVEAAFQAAHADRVRAEEQSAKDSHKTETAAAEPQAPAAPAGSAAEQGATGSQEAASPPEATPTAAAPQPPDVPWISKDTGEFTKPTDAQLRDQFHRMFAAADAAGSGMRATAASRALADSWGIPRERLIEQRRYALDERNKGFEFGDTRAPEPASEAAPAGETDDATPTGSNEAGGEPQHQSGDGGGETATASGSNRAERGAEDSEAGTEAPATAGKTEVADEATAVREEPAQVDKSKRPEETAAHENDNASIAQNSHANESDGAHVQNANRVQSGDGTVADVSGGRPSKGGGDRARESGADGSLEPAAGRRSESERVVAQATDAQREHILAADKFNPADAKALLGEKPLSRKDAVQALRDLRGDQTLEAADLAGVPSKRVGKTLKYDPVEVARAARDQWRSARNITETAASRVESAAAEAATHPENARPEPTDAQKEAGNYAKGHVNLHGLDVSIENPAGTSRRPEWPVLKNHYGYIRRTNGADGEHVDVFLGPHAEDASKPVFVVDQIDPKTGKFDEHKAMLGFSNGGEARRAYRENYSQGWKGFGALHKMSVDSFKEWVKSNATKKPAAEHVGARDGAELETPASAKPEAVDERAQAAKEIVGESVGENTQGAEAAAAVEGGKAPEAVARTGKRASKAELAAKAEAIMEGRKIRKPDGSFRQGPPDDDATVAHVESVSKAVRDAVKDWGENAPTVRVVASADELPASAKAASDRYARAKGFYDGKGTAYIVAKNHASAEDALRTVAHEAIGHHGVERILNDHVPGGWDKLVADVDRLRKEGLGSAETKSILENVAKRYPGADARTFAKEFIAVAAERGVRNGLVGRVIAAVRAFLRTIMPNLRINDADIRALLQHSEDFIRAGTPLEQRQAQVAAMSFSASEDAGLTAGERRNPNAVADAARAWREQGTDSPYFRKFFGDSKVVDPAGKPRIVYHGTGEDFSVFESAKAGSATEHSTSPLGHFFTENRKLAERYAENAADGRPADQRVVDAYVRMSKPYEMSLDEAHAIDDPAQARALRAKLEREGYDGIHIAEAKSWVPFDSEQIKSVENRGTFDPVHQDINFSLPEASMDTLDDVLSKPDGTAFERAKEWLRGKAENLRPAALGALQRRHLTELMDQHPALKGYGKMYDERTQKLDSERQQYMAGAPDAAEHPEDMIKRGGATIAGDLRNAMFEKGPGGWLGRRKPVERQLADVMHTATMHGLDPSREYTRLIMEDKNGQFVQWTPQAIKERMRVLREQMLGRSGDDKTAMIEERKALKAMPAREAAREKTWPQLVAAWNALPEEAKTLYKQQRDWYSQHRDETEKALIANVESIGRDMAATGGKDMAARFMQQAIKRIRLQFEMNRLEGVYFPLNRDGDYWMSIHDKEGREGFKMFESAEEAARAEKKLKGSGFTIEAQGRRDGDYRAKDAPSGTFVADVIGILKKAGAPEKVQDQIYQTFLRTLPEMSMRKHSIHRRKVPGFDSDIVRTFSKNAFHGAHQLARLRNAHEMQSIVQAAQTSLDNYRRGGAETLDIAKADALLSELKKRHDYIMSPKDSSLANVANSIGFLYYLGATPASAIVNLTQNAQVTLPVLGAHHGWGKATRMLGAAVRDSLRTGGNIDRTLTSPEDRAAYNALRARGDIDKTQSHTLAGLAEGSALTSNPVWARAMHGMSYLFHKAEVVNREAAGMASFRLARSRGDDFASAVQYASDIINGTHFDYSAANRPRYMQGNAARAALQFKNYGVGMSWMLYRNLYQAFRGESAEVKSIARKTLTGVLGMTALMAGTMGLPIFNALRFAGNAAHTLFGDDEPNWDFDTEFRAWLGENLGEDAAKYVADGAVNRLGATVSNRVSLANLWWPDSDRELEGKDQYYALLDTIAGPLGGIAKNMFVGSKMVGDGNVWRGVETMMPKFAKDAMKATRFAHDGANTLRGDPILPDVSGSEAFVQSLGFQPTRLFEQQRTNSALKNYEQGIIDRRQQLVNAYAMAVRSGDDRDVAMAKIHEFNAQYPEIALKAESIRQSLRARARYSATSENGIFLNRKVASRVRDQVGVPAQ